MNLKVVETASAGLTLTARLGRQGKSAASGQAHVVGKTEEFAHVTNTPCWRFRQIVERFQSSDRRRSRFNQGTGS